MKDNIPHITSTVPRGPINPPYPVVVTDPIGEPGLRLRPRHVPPPRGLNLTCLSTNKSYSPPCPGVRVGSPKSQQSKQTSYPTAPMPFKPQADPLHLALPDKMAQRKYTEPSRPALREVDSKTDSKETRLANQQQQQQQPPPPSYPKRYISRPLVRPRNVDGPMPARPRGPPPPPQAKYFPSYRAGRPPSSQQVSRGEGTGRSGNSISKDYKMGNQRKLERRNTPLQPGRDEKRGSAESKKEEERQQEQGEGKEFARSTEESMWSEYWDEEVEASYYYNRLTGEATWIKPEGFDAEEYDKLGTTIGSNNSWDEGAINEVDPWPDEKK